MTSPCLTAATQRIVYLESVLASTKEGDRTSLAIGSAPVSDAAIKSEIRVLQSRIDREKAGELACIFPSVQVYNEKHGWGAEGKRINTRSALLGAWSRQQAIYDANPLFQQNVQTSLQTFSARSPSLSWVPGIPNGVLIGAGVAGILGVGALAWALRRK